MWTDVAQTAYAYTGGKPFEHAHPCVVMLHGAQNDHSVWALQSRYLAHHGYKVLAFDLPAHGRSTGPALTSVQAMASWVLDQLAALNIQHAHLIGHSMGSLIALEISGQNPALVHSLALLGTSAPMPVSQGLLQTIEQSPIQAMHQINAWSHRSSIDAFVTINPGSNPIGGGFALMRRIAQQHGSAVLSNDFHACNNYQQGLDRLSNVVAPTLIMNGLNDSMTTAKAAQSMCSRNSHITLKLLPDCGHALMSEQPNLVLNALIDHLHRANTVNTSQ